MIASDGLKLGTALAQLKNLKREFDALETAASKARLQLDRILEQLDFEDLHQPDRDDDGQSAAPQCAAVTTANGAEVSATNTADAAATAIEQSFNDDVDSLFDAELIVDDVLGGRRFDEAEAALAEPSSPSDLSDDVRDAIAALEIDFDGAGREDGLDRDDQIAALAHDAGTAVESDAPDREISLECSDEEDDTDKLIACLSVREPDDREAAGDSCETLPVADEEEMFEGRALEHEAVTAAPAMAPVSRNDDDIEIMTSSMHQPVMAFADDHMTWKPACDDAAIVIISDDDLSNTVASCLQADDDACDPSVESAEADAIDNAGDTALLTDLELVRTDGEGGAELPEAEIEAAMLVEDEPEATAAESDAPEAPAKDTDEDSTSESTADAMEQTDNVVALTKPMRDDPAPPRRRGGVATAVLGAGAIAATLAIAPQYLPMDSLQHFQSVQDLLHQLSQLKQYLA